MAMKWGTETTIKCLEEYAKHSCLWDVNNPNYKNKHERNLALQRIVQKLNIESFDVNALKLKIHSIRNTYVNEITKVLRSKRSGVAPSEVYKPKLSWFRLADSFLRNIIKKRVHYSNVHVTLDEMPHFGGNLNNSDENFKKYQKPLHMRNSSLALRNVSLSRSPEQSTYEFVETHYDHTPETVSFSESGNANIGKKNELNHRYTNLDRSFVTLRELSSDAAEDEFDVFAKSIAVQMRQLTPKDALEVQAEIQNLLVRKRLNALRRIRSKYVASWDSDASCSSKSSSFSCPVSPTHTS